jgi:hypothetical protein
MSPERRDALSGKDSPPGTDSRNQSGRIASPVDFSAERQVLGQLAWCTNELLAAINYEDAIAFHYVFQGTEFELVRAFWLLEDEERATRIHSSIGEHSPDKCPVCSGAAAFATPTPPEGTRA